MCRENDLYHEQEFEQSAAVLRDALFDREDNLGPWRTLYARKLMEYTAPRDGNL